jgi:hypothetical protein
MMPLFSRYFLNSSFFASGLWRAQATLGIGRERHAAAAAGGGARHAARAAAHLERGGRSHIRR